MYRGYESHHHATGGSFAYHQAYLREFKALLRRQLRHHPALLIGLVVIALCVVIAVAMTWHGTLPGGVPPPFLLLLLAGIIFTVHGFRHRHLPQAEVQSW